MADGRRGRGIAGEDAAARLLSGLGYDLLARNFRTQYGELDIVAVDREWLVFCEVRARVGRPSLAIALAKESVGPGKQLQLRKMAGEWFRLAAQHVRTSRSRFDVVAVSLTAAGRVLELEHVVDAF